MDLKLIIVLLIINKLIITILKSNMFSHQIVKFINKINNCFKKN